jgi:hypothetical protein
VALGVVALGAAFGWFALQDAQMHGEWLLGRDCPFGAELAGAHPPNGTTEWCQRKDQTGSYVKYGVWNSPGFVDIPGSMISTRGVTDGKTQTTEVYTAVQG